METLFESVYVRDEKVAKETFRYFYFQRKVLIACYVVMASSFLVAIPLAISGSSNVWPVFIFVPLFFAIVIYRYIQAVRMSVKRDRELFGEDVTIRSVATDTYVQNLTPDGGNAKAEYRNIRSAVQTKNLILLFTQANLIYIFKKDSFTKGTAEDFIRHLRNRGLQIK